MKWIRAIPPKITARVLATALLAGIALGATPPARAQGSRKDDIVFNAQGRPMAGATVRVCTSSATGQPCSPLANIYSDAALTQALANPTTTDGLGNYSFYAAPGRYEIEISGPSITTKQMPNVILPNDPSAPTFTSVTSTSGISAFSLSLSGNLTVNGSAAVTGSLTVAGNPVPTTNQANDWTQPQTFSSGLTVQGPTPFWRDVSAFGAQSHTMGGTTGTIASTSHTLTVAAALDFNKTNGIFIADAGPVNTLATPTIVNVNCFGPAETSFGTCGSTTYTYAVSRVDQYGGYSAASTAVVFTTGPTTLSPDNYNMGFGGSQLTVPQTTDAIYVWKKVGAGSYSCLGQFVEPFEGYDYFYFEDWGQASNCPPWVPSSPPVAAGHDPLISTITNISGTTFTLADAATASVTSDYVFPDDSVAVKAAMTAANNDAPSNLGGTCVLFPAGGEFYVSNLNELDLFGGGPPHPSLCVRQGGGVTTFNMPVILSAGNIDWGGIGGNYPGFRALYGAAGIAALAPGTYTNVHDLGIRPSVGSGLLVSGSNFHDSYISVSEGSDYAPLEVFGSGSLIFGELDHLTLLAENTAVAPASVLFDCQLGGTSNTINIHDNAYSFHAYKFQSESNGGGGGNQCSLHTISDKFNEVENSWDHGWYNIDTGDAAQNYGVTLAQNNEAIGDTNNDPNTSYPSFEYDVQSGHAGITNMYLAGDLWVGPLYSNNLILAGTYQGPCNLFAGWIVNGANGGSYRGSNTGCDGGGLTNLPGGDNAGGVETDGTFNAFQTEFSVSAPSQPSFVQTAVRPTWISLTTSGSGGTLAAATYYYVLVGCMTSSNTANCTNPSYELHVTTSGSTSSNALSFYNEGYAYTSRFDHCQIWRGTSAGAENTYQTTACTGVGPTSFTDTGAAGTAGAPSPYNTAFFTAFNTADSAASFINAATNGDLNHPFAVGDFSCSAGVKFCVNGPMSASSTSSVPLMVASPFATLTDAATISWTVNGAPNPRATVTLGGNRTLSVTNQVAGGSYLLRVVQDGTGSRTLTLGTGGTGGCAAWKVAGGGSGALTLSTAAGAVDMLGWVYDGTNCDAILNTNFN